MPVFETASIKLTDAKGGNGHSRENDGPGLLRASMTLKSFIMTAYDLQAYQVTGGPSWIDSSTYEIVARLERGGDESPTGDERPLHLALQSLLAERFQLKFHRQIRDVPAFALTTAKSGSKLKESLANGKCGTDSVPGPGRTVIGRCADVETVRRLIARQVDRPVFDQTDLKSRYDFTLQWRPENFKGAATEEQMALPSFFTALEEQLGLTLEPRKMPVEALVVDSAERPSEN